METKVGRPALEYLYRNNKGWLGGGGRGLSKSESGKYLESV